MTTVAEETSTATLQTGLIDNAQSGAEIPVLTESSSTTEQARRAYQSGPSPLRLGIPECAHKPPSATKYAPVTNEASSEARKSATLAISCGSP